MYVNQSEAHIYLCVSRRVTEVEARNDCGRLYSVLGRHAWYTDFSAGAVIVLGVSHTVSYVAVVLLHARGQGVEVVLVSHAVSRSVSAPELDTVIIAPSGEDMT